MNEDTKFIVTAIVVFLPLALACYKCLFHSKKTKSHWERDVFFVVNIVGYSDTADVEFEQDMARLVVWENAHPAGAQTPEESREYDTLLHSAGGSRLLMLAEKNKSFWTDPTLGRLHEKMPGLK